MSTTKPAYPLLSPAIPPLPQKLLDLDSLLKFHLLDSLKLELYDLNFRSYSLMIFFFFFWKYGLYEILHSVLMVSRMVLVRDLNSFGPLLPAPTLPRQKPLGGPQSIICFKSLGFHPVLSEPPLSNTICRDLYYRMTKMDRI